MPLILLALIWLGTPAQAQVSQGPPDHPTGSVVGYIHWRGDLPQARIVDLKPCKTCAIHSATGHWVFSPGIVNENATLRDVVVQVASDSENAAPREALEPLVIRVENGEFRPRVAVLRVGQDLEIHKIDNEGVANAHFRAKRNDEANLTIAPGRRWRRLTTASRTERGFAMLTDDIHHQRRSDIAILAHPFHDVSNDRGRYEIHGLPPGRHQLRAMHPAYGEKSVTVEVIAGDERRQDFQFARDIDLLADSTLEDWSAWFRHPDATKDEVWSVEDGVLVGRLGPAGCLLTDRIFNDYELELQWRFPPESRGGKCGVFLHATEPHRHVGWPKGVEIDLESGGAGDFRVIGTDIKVSRNAARRKAEAKVGQLETSLIERLDDIVEHPIGEWNDLRVRCVGRRVKVWINGSLANEGWDCTENRGRIAIRTEGAKVRFRKIRLRSI